MRRLSIIVEDSNIRGVGSRLTYTRSCQDAEMVKEVLPGVIGSILKEWPELFDTTLLWELHITCQSM